MIEEVTATCLLQAISQAARLRLTRRSQAWARSLDTCTSIGVRRISWSGPAWACCTRSLETHLSDTTHKDRRQQPFPRGHSIRRPSMMSRLPGRSTLKRLSLMMQSSAPAERRQRARQRAANSAGSNGLLNEVVRARFESLEPVVEGAARGKNQGRPSSAAAATPAHESRSVGPRQSHIDHREREFIRSMAAERPRRVDR